MSVFLSEIKRTEPVNVLSYERAYNQLIAYINERYWRLEDYTDSLVHRDTLRKYRAVDGGNRYSNSGFLGERRLNKFLDNIATGGAEDASCQALLDLVTGKMKSPDGLEFPWCLAKAICAGVFEIGDTVPTRDIITLHGSQARAWREKIDGAKKAAEGRNERFQFGEDLSNALERIAHSLPSGSGGLGLL